MAWAYTIHKSQGLTLPAAVIDIGDQVFTGCVAYVALTRATNLEDLCDELVLEEMNNIRQRTRN